MIKPKFMKAWMHFSQINIPVKEVGEKIGGYVAINIESGIFQNACPIRMSYVLNMSGVLIPKSSEYAVVSGKDKKQFMYRVNDMIKYLKKVFGEPDLVVKKPQKKDFIGKKGIIVFSGNGWSNARGHVTLWNGNICSDACHFMGSDENGSFVPETALLWELP